MWMFCSLFFFPLPSPISFTEFCTLSIPDLRSSAFNAMFFYKLRCNTGQICQRFKLALVQWYNSQNQILKMQILLVNAALTENRRRMTRL
ncbi:hypothetical protein L210DRAFT_2237097 [Boletus edulis BED1]|uniref:Secreted protein n=1 Tax=Boletus edulis BED1 TaxID=1328754 RepID=A0AAD4BTI1_BOLED|nr:hypothetical protein L210DRAFT_2237097 [Boletus edulis BED1]